MSFELDAYVLRHDAWSGIWDAATDPAIRLPMDFVLIPCTDDVMTRVRSCLKLHASGVDEDDLVVAALSSVTPVAHVSCSSWGGGFGLESQSARVWEHNQLVANWSESDLTTTSGAGPVNRALSRLGVRPADDADEFDTLGLGRCRSTADWEFAGQWQSRWSHSIPDDMSRDFRVLSPDGFTTKNLVGRASGYPRHGRQIMIVMQAANNVVLDVLRPVYERFVTGELTDGVLNGFLQRMESPSLEAFVLKHPAMLGYFIQQTGSTAALERQLFSAASTDTPAAKGVVEEVLGIHFESESNDWKIVMRGLTIPDVDGVQR